MAKLTKQKYRKNIPLLLGLMERETKPCGLAGREQRKKRAAEDFWYFFWHYLPHYAEQDSPAFHKEIIAMLENQEIRRMSVAAPRGFSKSTLVSFAYAVWSILFEKYYFIVLVSATDALAKDLSDFIRLEFTDNQRILEDFGLLLLGQGSEGDFTAHNRRSKAGKILIEQLLYFPSSARCMMTARTLWTGLSRCWKRGQAWVRASASCPGRSREDLEALFSGESSVLRIRVFLRLRGGNGSFSEERRIKKFSNAF